MRWNAHKDKQVADHVSVADFASSPQAVRPPQSGTTVRYRNLDIGEHDESDALEGIIEIVVLCCRSFANPTGI
jgi:hypothetical protein